MIRTAPAEGSHRFQLFDFRANPKTETVTVTVSDTVAVNAGVALNMAVAVPGTACPGLPGPRMDVERD